ncbi:MAG TPA: FkbM family methyltransferase [Verrucomicrobiae bacterium]|jgi:FkbM family methyltransferase
MKSLVKQTLLRFGIRAYGPGSIPKGIDLFHDLHRYHLIEAIETIVDVGANVGHFSLECNRALPNRRILAFEPCGDTFNKLRENVACHPNITTCRAALGSKSGTASLNILEKSEFNSLLSLSDKEPTSNDKMERVTVKTLDEVVAESKLKAVDFLKTDTEGFDVEVLKGAESLLAKRSIKLVLCEVGFHADDNRHTPFSAVWKLLAAGGFDLFGFYDQSRFRRAGALDYCNALFISPRGNSS